MVFVRRVDRDAFSVDVDRKTPAYIRVPSNVSVKEERPRWDLLLNWANVSGGDHLMKNYTSILASDLKFSIRSYSGANDVTVENTQKIIAYLDEELKSIRATHNEVEKQMFLSSGGAFADATSTRSTPANAQSQSEKMHRLDEALES